MGNTLYAAALAASFVLPAINAGPVAMYHEARTASTVLPPCSTGFTDYIYAGCFTDPVSKGYPRALSFDAGLDFGSMTVDTCAAVCKSNGFRYAGLEYYGQCFCGNSVSGSLTTPDHCTYPCNGNSSETCGGSYAMSVYQDPTYSFIPTTDITLIYDYKNEGCYVDSVGGRALTYFQSQLSRTNMTTEDCLKTCKSQNYPIAGLEYGQECYCGVVFANSTAKAPDSDCNVQCDGWCPDCDNVDYQYCGGSNRLNVWVASDVQSNQPCAAAVPAAAPSSSSSSSSAAPSSSSLSSIFFANSSSSSTATVSSTSSYYSTSSSSSTTSSIVPSSSSSTAASSSSIAIAPTSSGVVPSSSSSMVLSSSNSSIITSTSTKVFPSSSGNSSSSSSVVVTSSSSAKAISSSSISSQISTSSSSSSVVPSVSSGNSTVATVTISSTKTTVVPASSITSITVTTSTSTSSAAQSTSTADKGKGGKGGDN